MEETLLLVGDSLAMLCPAILALATPCRCREGYKANLWTCEQGPWRLRANEWPQVSSGSANFDDEAVAGGRG